MGTCDLLENLLFKWNLQGSVTQLSGVDEGVHR